MEWYLGDTTQSLGYLAANYVDVAFTYNEAAELAAVKSGGAVKRELVFLVSTVLCSLHMLISILIGPFLSGWTTV